MSRENGTFSLVTNAAIMEGDKDDVNLPFMMWGDMFETQKFGNKSNSTEIKTGKYATVQTTIEIKTFHSTSFKEKSLYKAFYPVNIDEIKTFQEQFETVTHVRGKIVYGCDCLRIKLNGQLYDVTQLKNQEKGFYIIECFEEQTLEEFLNASFSIRQAIGFINRLMPGSEEFIFDKAGKVYYSNYIRPTIRGMYSPIVTNPYSKPDIEREIANKFLKKLTRIPLDNLSNLVHRIHTEREFSVAILVILEATSIRSLLIIPSAFAIIIEQLSKHLSGEETGLETPIADNELKKKIIDDLHKVIDDNNKNLSAKAVLKLKRRLTDINKPVNKQRLTNIEKLIRPFKQYNIDLTPHDISIMEHRNDLLHGDILMKRHNTNHTKTADLYMAYVSAKLFTLISKLILKTIGYNGYVYNQAKYLEKHLGITTNEEYFEKIGSCD